MSHPLRIVRDMWSTLLPPRCPICGTTGPAPCPACWLRLEAAPPLALPAGVDGCRSLLRYEGAGRLLLSRLKYRNARSALAWLAMGMAALVDNPAGGFDVVTWAPTTPSRRRLRGYDQAELLARRVGRHLGVAVLPLLSREPGPPQTGRSRAQRVGVDNQPRFRPRGHAPPRVLLVDDVLTTGATVTAAAQVLRACGARSVSVVTAGCTPLKIPPALADP